MNRSARYITPGWRSSFPHRCLGCGLRKALFSFRGRVYAKRDHTLCPRCFGSLVDSTHAQMGKHREGHGPLC
jgi:hypothetical protein